MGNIALPATGALEMIKLTGKVKSVPYVIILESTTLWFYLQRGEVNQTRRNQMGLNFEVGEAASKL